MYSEDIMAQTKKKSEHYVNNKEFLAAMVEYKKSVDKAKKEKVEKPPVPDYVGECFLKIANHLSYRPNFINYTYRDDMISDGIENCLQYLDNFNPKHQVIRLLTLHKSFITPLLEEYKRRKNK